MSGIGKKVKNTILVDSKRMAPNQTAKPTYCCFKIFNLDLVGVELRKVRGVLDKTVAVGFTILELFRLLMYEF